MVHQQHFTFRWCFWALFFAAPLVAPAQNIHQQLYWIRQTLRLNLRPQWAFQLEVDERRAIRPDRQAQFIVHAQVQRRAGAHWTLSLLQSFSSVTRNGLDIPEWRPSQEALFAQTWSNRWSLSGRMRIEQRWLHRNDGKVLTDGYQFRLRFRYRLQGEWRANPRWLFRCNDEFMHHHDGVDQNRIYLSATRRLHQHCSAELGYLKVLQQRNNNPGLLDQDVLRLTLHWAY